MANMTLYNFKDKKKQDLLVSDDVFATKLHTDVINQTVQYHLRNQQTGLANTKTRGEVRGGGRKPWRQKGTGRARQGSTRSPLWIGGGIAFGPRNKTVEVRLPKKMRRLAIRSVLSARLQEGKLWAYEALELSQPKTKEVTTLLKEIPSAKKLLIVSHEKDDLLKLATKNLESVSLLETAIPSVLDLLNSDFVLLHKDVVRKIEEKYGKVKQSKKIADVQPVETKKIEESLIEKTEQVKEEKLPKKAKVSLTRTTKKVTGKKISSSKKKEDKEGDK